MNFLLNYCIDNRNAEELAKGEHKVMVRVISFVDSGLLLRAYAWSRNPTEGFELKCDLLKTIKERFDAEGIEIPYPYRTIVYKNQPDKSL